MLHHPTSISFFFCIYVGILISTLYLFQQTAPLGLRRKPWSPCSCPLASYLTLSLSSHSHISSTFCIILKTLYVRRFFLFFCIIQSNVFFFSFLPFTQLCVRRSFLVHLCVLCVCVSYNTDPSNYGDWGFGVKKVWSNFLQCIQKLLQQQQHQCMHIRRRSIWYPLQWDAAWMTIKREHPQTCRKLK